MTSEARPTVAVRNVATGAVVRATVGRSGADWLNVRLPGHAKARIWRHAHTKSDKIRGPWRIVDATEANAIPIDEDGDVERDRTRQRYRRDGTASWWCV